MVNYHKVAVAVADDKFVFCVVPMLSLSHTHTHTYIYRLLKVVADRKLKHTWIASTAITITVAITCTITVTIYYASQLGNPVEVFTRTWPVRVPGPKTHKAIVTTTTTVTNNAQCALMPSRLRRVHTTKYSRATNWRPSGCDKKYTIWKYFLHTYIYMSMRTYINLSLRHLNELKYFKIFWPIKLKKRILTFYFPIWKLNAIQCNLNKSILNLSDQYQLYLIVSIQTNGHFCNISSYSKKLIISDLTIH